jgi:hypothetical protein
MLINANADTAQGTIVNPDGTLANRPTIQLSKDDAELLRSYKRFLQRLGLREALYCNHCWSGDREDGCKAFVTDSQIAVICRCRMRVHLGQTF